MYVFGNDCFGQLGCKKTGIIDQHSWNSNDQILEIYTGSSANHSFIRNKEGYFAFGLNDNQQLGLKGETFYPKPTLNKLLSNTKVKDMKLGSSKTFILTGTILIDLTFQKMEKYIFLDFHHFLKYQMKKKCYFSKINV